MNSTISTSGKAHALKCELAAEVLRSFDTLRVKVNGWSMLPSIWPGDTLIVEPVDPETLMRGDIVLFLRRGRICVHRIVAKEAATGGWEILTRGDAMPQADPPLAANEIRGKVRLILRSNKEFVPAQKIGLFRVMLACLLRRSWLINRILVRSRQLFQTPEPEVI